MGALCRLALYALGRLRQYSVSPLGHLCHSVAINHYFFEPIIDLFWKSCVKCFPVTKSSNNIFTKHPFTGNVLILLFIFDWQRRFLGFLFWQLCFLMMFLEPLISCVSTSISVFVFLVRSIVVSVASIKITSYYMSLFISAFRPGKENPGCLDETHLKITLLSTHILFLWFLKQFSQN